MNGVIIGIMGQARAGKDTTAIYLNEKYGFIRVGLADPMKRFCRDVFDFSDEQLYGNKRDAPDHRYIQKQWIDGMGVENKKYLSPRYALQTLGTEWGRGCYDNVWINYGIRVAQSILTGRNSYHIKTGLTPQAVNLGVPGVVFSDLRFINEYEAVKKAGGVMVRIKRPGFDGSVGVENHASEKEQGSIDDSKFDIILNNNKGIPDLYKQVDLKFKEQGVLK